MGKGLEFLSFKCCEFEVFNLGTPTFMKSMSILQAIIYNLNCGCVC